MVVKIAPYGTWSSPITPDAIVENSATITEIFVDPVTSKIYYIEERPAEEGRNVIVNAASGADVFGPGWDSRTGVEEYGGAAAIAYNDVIYFSNFADNRVYSISTAGASPQAITPVNENYRYANFAVHPLFPQLLVAILEDHTKPAPADVVTTLHLIDSKNTVISLLVSGADFYAAPCFTPDGAKLAWQEWYFPDMPWQGGEINVGDITVNDNVATVTNAQCVAGKRQEISAGYPAWITNDLLLFTSDESGYQNPWTYSVSADKAAPALASPIAQEFSEPAWGLGGSYGAPLDKEGNMALFTAIQNGRSTLYSLDLRNGTSREFVPPYVGITYIKPVTDNTVVFLGAEDTASGGIVICTVQGTEITFNPIKPSSSINGPNISTSYISLAQPLTLLALPGNEPLFANYYAPTNPNYAGPEGERPPCVVNVHGGPTGMSVQELNWKVQYFTSRGWAWLDVNYGGSSGYGRQYTARLDSQWGIVDVRDCVSAMQQVGSAPLSLIDSSRAVITGGSAGGFTALASLCQYPNVFAAGTSSYGISNLRKLDELTHKFESHYCAILLGGTLAQIPQVYDARSPVNNADKIRSPLLILQGALDAVVPPEQAEEMVENMKVVAEYVRFPDEGHGWRKADNIKTALETEIEWYQKVLDIVPE